MRALELAATRWQSERHVLSNMLLKLERRGLLKLPIPSHDGHNRSRERKVVAMPHSSTPIETDLSTLHPLRLLEVRGCGHNNDLFNHLLSNYHYLGFKNIVGEYMKYLVSDRSERPLGCVLFGAAAWKAKSRDNYIGWSIPKRGKDLNYLTEPNYGKRLTKWKKKLTLNWKWMKITFKKQDLRRWYQ